MQFVSLSYRNIWRHKWRTILDIMAIAFNIAFLLWYVSIFRGRVVITIDNITKMQTGHVQIHHKDYDINTSLLPLDINIPNAKALQETLRGVRGVKEVSPRIEFKGSLSNGVDRIEISGVGLDPGAEHKISILPESIKKGTYFTADDETILIGSRLAKLLDVDVGDYVFLYGRTQDNVHNLLELEVGGVFEFGFPMMDKYFVFTTLALADDFLQMNGAATELMITKKDGMKLAKVETAISDELNDKPLIVRNWTHFAQAALQDIYADAKITGTMLGILILVAIIGIFNTISMGMYERTREIGTLRAMGFGKQEVSSILKWELVFLGLTGAIVGCVVGFLLQLWMVKSGIPLGIEFEESLTIPFGNRMMGAMGVTEYIVSAVIGVGAAFLGGLWPVRRALRVKIVDALRFN